MKERIGFIGLGIMGKPMARNLMKAGFSLTVFNRSKESVKELEAEGAKAARSVQEVGEQSDIVITMLPDSPDVESVVLGPGGLFESARRDSLFIDMSTISPAVSQKIAAEGESRGLHALDAPVSGGDKGAIAGTLSIMVGGRAEDFKRAMPLFEGMGKTITHCGPSGAGQVVKACNQVVVALVIEAVSEALVLGTKAGVQPETILKVLSGGLGQTKLMDMRGPTMIQHNFEPGFKARLHRKDLGIILRTAHELGVVLPVTALIDQMFTRLIQNGRGDQDHSSLLTIIEELSNHSINIER
jgi:2-hydroxy-3-oxopropionate reductase